MSTDKYRELLVSLEQKSQETYDKAVLTLSGGALGVSIAFLKDIVKIAEAAYISVLVGAWSCWALSVACCLSSQLVSAAALRHAVVDLDNNVAAPAHQAWDKATGILNVLGGALFVLGAMLFSLFAGGNLL